MRLTRRGERAVHSSAFNEEERSGRLERSRVRRQRRCVVVSKGSMEA